MPNLPAGGAFSGSSFGEGWLQCGLGITYSQRTTLQTEDDRVANMNNSTAQGVITSLDLSLGLWKGLSFHTIFSGLLVTAASNSDGRETEFGIGDMPVSLNYLFSSKKMPPPWRFGIGAGVFLPIGNLGSVSNNANYETGTYDPVINLSYSYDFKDNAGLYGHGLSRMTLYENDSGLKTGSSILYGGGFRLRYPNSLTLSLGVNVLHRFEDDRPSEDPSTETEMDDGDAMMMDERGGGDFVFAAITLGYLVTKGSWAGFSVMFVAQIPVYQRINGTALAEDFNTTLSIGYGFQMFGK